MGGGGGERQEVLLPAELPTHHVKAAGVKPGSSSKWDLCERAAGPSLNFFTCKMAGILRITLNNSRADLTEGLGT